MDFVNWLLGAHDSKHPIWITSTSVVTVGDLRQRIKRAQNHSAQKIVVIQHAEPLDYLVKILSALSMGQIPWLVHQNKAMSQEDAIHAISITPGWFEGLIIQTSGSGGKIRHVCLGLEGIQHNINAILSYLPIKKNQRIGLLTPLHYSYGLIGQCFTALKAGATLVVPKQGPWIVEQTQLFAKHAVSGLSAVPTTLHQLHNIETPLQLEWLASAGAPLPAQLAQSLMTAFS